MTRTAMTTWEPGHTVADRYTLRAFAGAGGLGRVHRATDLHTGRDVFIKALDPERCPADRLARCAAVVQAALHADQLSDTNIVLPRDAVALDASPPYVVGPWIDGEDLDALRARYPLPWQRAFDIVTTCARLLTALHAATGKPHAALKPGNLRTDEDGNLHVLDFGISELGTQPVPPRSDGALVEYRAPEQLADAPGDLRSDVFSLGVLLFEMLTGSHPFTAPSAFKLSHRILLQPAPRLGDLAPPATPLPRHLDEILARALARRPDDRFKNCDEFAKVLGLMRRQPVVVADTPPPAGDAAPEETATAPPRPDDDNQPTRIHVPTPAAAPASSPAAIPADAPGTAVAAAKRPARPASPYTAEEFTERGPARLHAPTPEPTEQIVHASPSTPEPTEQIVHASAPTREARVEPRFAAPEPTLALTDVDSRRNVVVDDAEATEALPAAPRGLSPRDASAPAPAPAVAAAAPPTPAPPAPATAPAADPPAAQEPFLSLPLALVFVGSLVLIALLLVFG